MTYTWTGPVTTGDGVGGANGVGGGVGGATVVVVVVTWATEPETAPEDFFLLPAPLCNQQAPPSLVVVHALQPFTALHLVQQSAGEEESTCPMS